MRVGTFASVVLSIVLLGCSKPEAPEPPPPAPAAAPEKKPAPPRPEPVKNESAKLPKNPMPTIDVPKPAEPDPRRPETPCDRNEPGYKWVGTVVEDGKCAVGPCDCVKG